MKYKDEYIQILKEELKPAMGCTEPIAIAYASSIVRKYLKHEIKKINVLVSANIIKNVKSVVVPNTNGLRGIKSACAIGIVAGNSSLQLECISNVNDEEIEKCKEFLNKNIIFVKPSTSDFVFDIDITGYTDDEACQVRIVDYHTNVVTIKYNDEFIINKER